MTAKPVRKTPEAQTPAWQKDIPRYLAFLIVLCFLLIRIGFREIPIERDEGSYAYMGQLVMKGEVPYRDFYEMKPPALYYTYGVLSALSGGDVVIMHIWMALLVSMGGMLLFYLVRRWLDAGAGVIATLAYLVLAMTPYASGFSIQAEHLVAFFAIAGLLALTRGVQAGNRLMILLAGVLLWIADQAEWTLFCPPGHDPGASIPSFREQVPMVEQFCPGRALVSGRCYGSHAWFWTLDGHTGYPVRFLVLDRRLSASLYLQDRLGHGEEFVGEQSVQDV